MPSSHSSARLSSAAMPVAGTFGNLLFLHGVLLLLAEYVSGFSTVPSQGGKQASKQPNSRDKALCIGLNIPDDFTPASEKDFVAKLEAGISNAFTEANANNFNLRNANGLTLVQKCAEIQKNIKSNIKSSSSETGVNPSETGVNPDMSSLSTVFIPMNVPANATAKTVIHDVRTNPKLVDMFRLQIVEQILEQKKATLMSTEMMLEMTDPETGAIIENAEGRSLDWWNKRKCHYEDTMAGSYESVGWEYRRKWEWYKDIETYKRWSWKAWAFVSVGKEVSKCRRRQPQHVCAKPNGVDDTWPLTERHEDTQLEKKWHGGTESCRPVETCDWWVTLNNLYDETTFPLSITGLNAFCFSSMYHCQEHMVYDTFLEKCVKNDKYVCSEVSDAVKQNSMCDYCGDSETCKQFCYSSKTSGIDEAVKLSCKAAYNADNAHNVDANFDAAVAFHACMSSATHLDMHDDCHRCYVSAMSSSGEPDHPGCF